MPNKNKYDAVVAGHICLDLHPGFTDNDPDSVRQLLVPGRLINMDRMVMSTGGAVSNTGQTLLQLGISTRLMGKVGQDFFGSGICQLLTGGDTENNLIVDPQSSTSYSIVIAPPGVDRIFLHHPGANDTYSAADLDMDTIRGARLFHFGYPPLMRRMYENSGRELAEMLTRVKNAGLTTSLDMALPDPNSPAGKADWKIILHNVLPLTDIFLPSIEELLYMLDFRTYELVRDKAGSGDFTEHVDFSVLPELSSRLISMGTRIVVIKLGKRGIYIRTGSSSLLSTMGGARPDDLANWSHREFLAPANTVDNIVSTSGAGDAGIAGFLAAFLNGCPIEIALRAANAVAAQKIQSRESVGKIPPLPTIIKIMDTLSDDKFGLQEKYWNWQPEERIWAGKNDRKKH